MSEVVHLRTASPDFKVMKDRAGEVAFCGIIGQHFTLIKKKVTCKRCLKSYKAFLKKLW